MNGNRSFGKKAADAVKELQLSKQINPLWQVVDSGDKFGGGGFLIQVPKLKIGQVEVGPLWFATRKDKIYDQYSKDIMDSHIEGAVGGNILKHFEIIADYPGRKLYFKQVKK